MAKLTKIKRKCAILKIPAKREPKEVFIILIYKGKEKSEYPLPPFLFKNASSLLL
jgi:hypothetical protein